MRNNELITIILLSVIVAILLGLGIIVGLKSVDFRFKEKPVKMTEVRTDETGTNEIKGIEYVDFSKQIIVDENTHILYIGHIDYALKTTPTNNTYLCPYYSENGKMQKLVDGKIIELGN